jgi:hypothetical protein
MSLLYEKVYKVTAYYDGPRGGIADFEGKPHLFRSERDYGANVFFFLTPLSEELFQLAMGEKGSGFCLLPDPAREFRVRGRIRRVAMGAPLEVRWRRVSPDKHLARHPGKQRLL